MSVLAFCCLPPCGLYNPWVMGVSGDGYKCDETPTPDRTTLDIGTDFGLTPYASFCDGSPGCDPCEFHGIDPWDRELSNTFPTQIDYSSTVNEFPSAVNYCFCTPSAGCTPSHGGTQCEWFANDNDYPGSWFTPFNLLCLKTGIDIASQTVEETNYIGCCVTYFGEANCGQVACGCDLLYGNTTCNRSKVAYTFGDPCSSGGPCPPNVGYQYFTSEPVLTTYYSFDDAVTAGVIDSNDPLGVYTKALIFDSLTGDTFTARMLLRDHYVDPINDPISPGFGLLQGFFGLPPDDDAALFPNGPYSPDAYSYGAFPWVSITLTMTSGAYSGNTYTYNGYGTAQQFQNWAQSNWNPVINNVVQIFGSPNYWLGLRISPKALNVATGQYTPFHEYRRLMTRNVTIGYMPDNSDDFLIDSTSPTQVVWTARHRQFYTWTVDTTMQDVRAHGMEITNIQAAPGSCCNFEHCTRIRGWYGVTGSDPSVAPCTVTNPLVDISGTCGGVGIPLNTHEDDCFPSNCAVSQIAITYTGTCYGTTRSTCFPSWYNKPMDYDFVQNINDFTCSDSACIDLP